MRESAPDVTGSPVADSGPGALLVGRADCPDLREVARGLSESVSRLATAETPAAVRNVLDGQDWFPDLAVVLQSWPDQYSERDMALLLETLPLARLLCCYGPWCEADGRTRSLWPLSVRVPARGFTVRLRRELDVIAGRQPPLPLTAARDEIFRDEHGSSPVPSDAGAIVIRTDDRPLGQLARDVFTAAGWTADVQPTASSLTGAPDVILWDHAPWPQKLLGALRPLRRFSAASAVLGWMNLHDAEDVLNARAVGMADILPKLAPTQVWLAAASSFLRR